MKEQLTVAERLIVAADFKPERYSGRSGVEDRILALAESLEGTGVYLKINSGLRAGGYDLLEMLHQFGLKVFADLKLVDIPETLETDAMLLAEAKPELLTVMCVAGSEGMRRLKSMLPETEVLGVTILTSQNEQECRLVYGRGIEEAVQFFALQAKNAGCDGLISSPKEVSMLSKCFPNMTLNTPGIRPVWSMVEGDDQNPNRIMTPYDAIKAGVHRIVVGRPIVQSKDPLDAVKRTLEEIERALMA